MRHFNQQGQDILDALGIDYRTRPVTKVVLTVRSDALPELELTYLPLDDDTFEQNDTLCGRRGDVRAAQEGAGNEQRA